MRIGEPDPSLTGRAGLAAVGEFVEKVGMVGAFDEAIGSIKVRARGASAGELVVGLAQAQLAGTGYWSVWTRSAPMRSLPRCRRYRFWLPRPLPGWPGGSPPSTSPGSKPDRRR